MLRGPARCAAGDRCLPARREHQSGAARELEHARGAVPHDGRTRRTPARPPQHVATLKRLPPEVVQATGLFSDGELTPAENIVRAYLLKHGNDVEAMRLLARIGHRARRAGRCGAAARGGARRSHPTTAPPATTTPCVLRRAAQVPAGARGTRQAAAARARESSSICTLYATACVGLGEHEKAMPLYRELLADAPRAADLHLSVAHCLKTLGRQQEAIESYRASAAARPISAMPTGVSRISRPIASRTTRSRACSAEERRRPRRSSIATTCASRSARRSRTGASMQESWHYYERGNALKSSESRYRPEIIETQHAQADRGLHARVLRRAARVWAPRAPSRSSSWDCRAPAPPCSSRSSPRIRRSRARRNSPTFSASCSSCRGAIPTCRQSALPRRARAN